MHRSIRSFDIHPWQPAGIWLSSVPRLGGGGVTWTLSGWGGEFESEMKRFSNGIRVFYLLIWRRLKKESGKWLRRKDLQGLSFKPWSMRRKSWLLILSFTRQKLTIKFGLWVGAFEHSVWPLGEGIRGTNLRKIKYAGGRPVGFWRISTLSYTPFPFRDKMKDWK